MKIKMFAIFDKKGAFYGIPHFYHNKFEAMRGFGDLVNDGKSNVNKHPEDYQLFEIGEYDDQTGVLVSMKNPEHLDDALSYVQKIKGPDNGS